MNGDQLLALGLLLVAGFLVGGVVSFGRERRYLPAGIVAVLALLALAGAVLRLV